MRAPIVDAELSALLKDYRSGGLHVGSSNCTNLEHHADWNGPNAYGLRMRAGLSRAMVRDSLRDDGLDASIAEVRRWENTGSGRAMREGTVPSFMHARALAALYGVQPGQFLVCGECEIGPLKDVPAQPRSRAFPWRDDIERFIAGAPARVTKERRARGLSPRALARLAEVPVVDVVDLERGRVNEICSSAFMSVLRVLGLSARIRSKARRVPRKRLRAATLRRGAVQRAVAV